MHEAAVGIVSARDGAHEGSRDGFTPVPTAASCTNLRPTTAPDPFMNHAVDSRAR